MRLKRLSELRVSFCLSKFVFTNYCKTKATVELRLIKYDVHIIFLVRNWYKYNAIEASNQKRKY